MLKHLLRFIVLFLLLVVLSNCLSRKKFRQFLDPVVNRASPGAQWTTSKAAFFDKSMYTWETKWYPSMPIDHFSYRNTDHFKLKYLVNYTYFQCGGPLFFYTGNEGSIEGFAENTGIMWDLAPMFHAAIVFAEHRFYGQSMPFGNESYTYVEYLGYLSAIQALADFAHLITFLKTDKNELGHCPAATEIPVIAFGGSYGGMLSAWLRMKYPHIIAGAWASSAPLRSFYGTGVSPSSLSNVTTRTFVNSGCDRRAISEGFLAIQTMSLSVNGRKKLNEIFHVKPGSGMVSSDDFWRLYYYITSAIFYMAMTDYPYAAGFLEAMPSFPVKYACQFAKNVSPYEEELAEQLYKVINVYYNYSGQLQYNCFTKDCEDITTGALDAGLGWPWQTCTSMTMQDCDQGGDVDFFLNTCNVSGGLINSEIDDCVATFKDIGYVRGLYHLFAVHIRYGITYDAISNIIFTNGDLDPWSAGGVYDNSPGIKHAIKNGVYIYYMKDAAHHLDLRTPNTCDPPSVTSARFQIVNIIQCWTNENCETPPSSHELPDNSGWKVPENCKYIHNGYPWEEKKRSSHLHNSLLFGSLAPVLAIIKSHLIG